MSDVLLHDEGAFLRQMQEGLEQLESRLRRGDVRERHATLFVLGLPRSGTTLLTQLIAGGLGVACTNNLVARFWRTPLVGCRLSRIVLGDAGPSQFASNDGIGSEPASPHEFSWFWHRLIHMDTGHPSDYRPHEAAKRIDWDAVRLELVNIAAVFGRPVVYKPLELVGFHMRAFAECLPYSVFIYIERSSQDVARSLAQGRLRHFNDLNTWWSSYPLEYSELRSQPFATQIAGQVHYLREMYRRGLAALPQSRVCVLQYEDLCRQPRTALQHIADVVRATSGEHLQLSGRVPEHLAPSRPTVSADIANALAEALAHYQTNP